VRRIESGGLGSLRRMRKATMMNKNTLLRAFRRGCRPLLPWNQAEYQDCNTRLLCGRCGRCILHCVCPPASMRYRDDGRKLAEAHL